MKQLRWLLEFFIIIILCLPFALLPLPLAVRTGGLSGRLLFLLWGSRRRIAIQNIRLSVECGALKIGASPEAVAKESFINLGKSMAELAKIYYGFGDRIFDHIEVVGKEHFQKALGKGKGILMIGGHCGSWELAALTFGVKVRHGSGVARKQDNPYLNRMLEKVRLRYGNELIYKKGAIKRILSIMKKNGVVGILMDQAVLKDEGCLIDFLGRKAWTTKSTALIARKTGAAVLPAFIHRQGKGHVLTIHPEVPLCEEADAEKAVELDTAAYNATIERYVREHPDEWLWMHRRWKRASQEYS